MSSDRYEIDLDIHSDEYRERRTELEAEVRSGCPVSWTNAHGGHWAISGHAAVGNGLRDRNRFSAEKSVDANGRVIGGVTIPSAQGYRALPNESDPPEWNGFRAAISRAFAPQAVEQMRPMIERYTTEVIDHLIEAGEADLVMQFGSPITALITLDVLGMPLEDWHFYAEAIHLTFMGKSGDTETEIGLPAVQVRLAETIARRRQQPETGLLDELLATEANGGPLSDDDVKDLIFDILVGGFDTTAGLLAGSLRYLADKPDVRRRLVDDDAFLRTATEEFLRWISPAVGSGKTATQDYELEGQRIKAGDRLWFMYRAANWDPHEFDDPEQVDLERSPNRHFAFGAGIHRCVGSNLARAVFQTALRQFLIRLPDYYVMEEEVQPYPMACVNAGFASMPIRFTPGEKVNSTRILEHL